ncbi:FUSC family protein [Chromobacterium sp. Beijing]|uniref:FUSC family protein n=1 Tax=Chromobacterium sp. Beijing TaxID=2735795 RepID=UPI001F1A8F0A|nr:FUSC family protein [Chromobacterium sp. Beijing]UJB34031.1 hypothetical protein HQN78_25025 [Chromobacterium sp. Beijing]
MEGSRWRSWRILLTPYYLNLYARQAHVLRVAAAFLVGLALNLLFEIPHGSWMLVTILIVLGSVPHWGGVRRKALQRMGGSLLGRRPAWWPWPCTAIRRCPAICG